MSTGATPAVSQAIAQAADACTVPCDGQEAVAFAITAGLTGTLTFEGSMDGITYFTLPIWATAAGSGSGALANPVAQIVYVMGGPALRSVRARCSAFTSGSCTITGQADDNGVAALLPVNIINSALTINPLNSNIQASGAVTSSFSRHRGKSSGATTAGVLVKGSSGNLHHLVVSNTQAATAAYLKLYDKATAAVVGTDVPVMTLLVPGNTTIVIPYDLIRHSFVLGITYGIVGLAVDTDSTAVAADLVFLTMLYI